LARCFPMVDEVVGLPTSPGRALPGWSDALRWGWSVAGLRGRYAMVINLYRTQSLAGRGWMRFLSVWTSAPVRIEPVHRAPNQVWSCNQVEGFLQTIGQIDSATGSPSDGTPGRSHDGMVIPPAVMHEVRDWLNDLRDWGKLSGPLVVVALGGDRESRREAPERAEQWLSVIQQRWAVRPILIGLPKDPGLPRHSSVVHVDGRGRWELIQTTALISMADVVISTHSAPQHVAGLWGIPTVSLVGPSDPVRYRPPLPDDRLRQLQHPVPCAPCYYNRCPLQGAEHQRCLSGIAPEAIARAFGELLNSARLRQTAPVSPTVGRAVSCDSCD